MAISSVAQRSSNLTITQASCEVLTTAAVACRVLELSIIQVTATAQSLGFGKPQALGVTPATLTTFIRDDLGFPVCVTRCALTWGTSPTVPLVFSRRWNSAATAGVGITFVYPRGYAIAVSSSAVVWNITTALASDINFAIDE